MLLVSTKDFHYLLYFSVYGDNRRQDFSVFNFHMNLIVGIRSDIKRLGKG
jgi:hypothetical protein